MTVAPRRALAFILITIFIDTVGFGIIIPVLPGLLMDLLDGSLTTAALYGGWLMFLFSALQFVSAPVLGNLSDHFGRRPVLLASLAAFSADFIVMGLATTVGWLFLGRALSGIFSATYPVASAYVADLTAPEQRARSFGLMGEVARATLAHGGHVTGVIPAFLSDKERMLREVDESHSEADALAVLERGKRLDETGDGQGFGLAIAHELAQASGAAMTLTRSALGGLRVEIGWP